MRLQDKVALVTGATYGIGTTIVERLAEEGAAVVFTGRTEENGRAVEDRLRGVGREVLFVRGSVAVESDVVTTIDATVRAYGSLTTVVNNAAATDTTGPGRPDSHAVDYGPFGIRSNAIIVGFTPTGADVITKMVDNETFISAVPKAIPSPRLGNPVDVANGVVYLASDEAEYVNGVLRPVDGGMTCKLGIPDTSALGAIGEEP